MEKDEQPRPRRNKNLMRTYSVDRPDEIAVRIDAVKQEKYKATRSKTRLYNRDYKRAKKLGLTVAEYREQHSR